MPKLIALIKKNPAISEEQFKLYYETIHVPLIKSIFPMIGDYKRTYLLDADMLSGEFSLEGKAADKPYNVITELFFNKIEDLEAFFKIAAQAKNVEIIRKDELNFLISEKTVMYQIGDS